MVIPSVPAKTVKELIFRERMESFGSDIVGSTPDEWRKFIEAEIVKWTKIAQTAGLRPE